MGKHKKQRPKKIAPQNKSSTKTSSLRDAFIHLSGVLSFILSLFSPVIVVKDAIVLSLRIFLVAIFLFSAIFFLIIFKPSNRVQRIWKKVILIVSIVSIIVIVYYLYQQHKSKGVYETDAEQQALIQAQMLYNGGLYEQMLELYSSEELLDNPIANNNLGYMYSNGIFFEQNIEAARSYYEIASQKGLGEATHNLVALRFRDCKTYENVVDTLRYGYLADDTGTILFLASCIQGEKVTSDMISESSMPYLQIEIEKFLDSTADTQEDILSAAFGPWQHNGMISSSTPCSSQSIFEKLVFISSGYQNTGERRIYLYSYDKSIRQFLYSEFLEEYFITVTTNTQ